MLMKPTLTSYTDENSESRQDDTCSAQTEKVSIYTTTVGGPFKRKKKKRAIEHDTILMAKMSIMHLNAINPGHRDKVTACAL